MGHAGLEGADAGHDHGAFRSCEGVQRSLQGRRRWTGPARKQDGLRDPHGVLVHLTVQHVRGHIQQHGACGPRGRQSNGVGHQARDVGGVGDPVRPLGDRGHDGDLVDPGLQGAGLRVPCAGGAGDVKNGRAVQVGVGD